MSVAHSNTNTNNNAKTTQADPHGDHPRVVALQRSIDKLRAELGDHDAESIVQRHIRLLHRYNETKDATQRLIGIYAQSTQKTVTQIHTDLDLPLTE